MAPKLRPRKAAKVKGTDEGDPMDLDPASNDVDMQDAPDGLPPAQTRPRRRRSLPGRQAPSASSRARLRPSSSATDIPKLKPGYKFANDYVGRPPGYVRHPGPALRQSNAKHWPYGVISGGALIHMLEDLSRSSQKDHWQVCIWLESFFTRFGRVHNLDGLIVTSVQDMHRLMLAHRFWLGRKDFGANGDVLWVPGLEPRESYDPDWAANTKHNLPELPSTHRQKHWRAGEAQYMFGTIERPRKGELVCEKWVDEMKWERDIWQA